MTDVLVHSPVSSPSRGSNHDKYDSNHDLESPIVQDSGLRERKKFDRFPLDEQAEFEVVVEAAHYDSGKQLDDILEIILICLIDWAR